MKKSKKTIIYMLIALVITVSVAFVDAESIYAKSYSEDVQDAEWHSFKGSKTDTSADQRVVAVFDYLSAYDEFPEKYGVDSLGYDDEIGVAYRSGTDSIFFRNIKITSSSEVVLIAIPYETEKDAIRLHSRSEMVGSMEIMFLSLSDVRYSHVTYWYADKKWGRYSAYANYNCSASSYDGQTYTLHGLCDETGFSSRNDDYSYEMSLLSSKMKVFSDFDSAYNYLTTGDTSGMAWQGSTPKQTYSSDLLLNDFDVQFHDSNKFEECYLDVKYTIPDSLKSVSSFQIDMEERFDWVGTISGSVSDVTDSHTGTNYIDVLNHADGFRIYLKDIKAIDNFINKYDGAFDKALKRFVLGNLNYVNFPFSKYIIGTVKTSNLNIKFHLVAEKKYGHYVDYNLNLLSGVGVKNSYVPDTEGNYTSNNDTKVMGHYYADVGTDAAGNTTYNYYYYYSDGGKEKISAEDATNNTVTSTIEDGAIRIENNPVFNNNITVEGDNIRNEANSYADSKADSSTNKSFIDKFLGFFDIIENNTFLGVFAKVFGWLPVGVSSLITTALGIVVGIRVFKFFK